MKKIMYFLIPLCMILSQSRAEVSQTETQPVTLTDVQSQFLKDVVDNARCNLAKAAALIQEYFNDVKSTKLHCQFMEQFEQLIRDMENNVIGRLKAELENVQAEPIADPEYIKMLGMTYQITQEINHIVRLFYEAFNQYRYGARDLTSLKGLILQLNGGLGVGLVDQAKARFQALVPNVQELNKAIGHRHPELARDVDKFKKHITSVFSQQSSFGLLSALKRRMVTYGGGR